jgi:hypothetical protein
MMVCVLVMDASGTAVCGLCTLPQREEDCHSDVMQSRRDVARGCGLLRGLLGKI